MTIDEIARKIAAIDLDRHGMRGVHLLFADGGPDAPTKELQRVASYLKSAQLDDFGELWNLFRSFRKEDVQLQDQVFGQEYMSRTRNKRMMATMTPDYEQFRVWVGVPGYMESNHVDSGGEGLVLHVGGPRMLTERIQQITFPKESWVPIVTPAGYTMYGLVHTRDVPNLRFGTPLYMRKNSDNY